MINIDDFIKVEMKVGTILEVEEIPGSEKLWKLKVDLGLKSEDIENNAVIARKNDEAISNNSAATDKLRSEQNEIATSDALLAMTDTSNGHDIRQVLSGIKQFYSKEELIGRQAIFVANLQPRQMMGLESQAMIMAAEGEDKPILLSPSEKVPNGSKIR